MTFLPVLARELRVASRRALTYYSRFGMAAVGITVLFSMLWQSQSAPPGLRGKMIFAPLAVMTMAYCLVAGVRATADCLSEEKREGTLGLLFLTDLKGYDVVFGKLAATSLHLFYGLLAMLPFLGIPLMLGGVTGGEFGRVALVLVNSLWFSLSIGMWISARSRQDQKAIWSAIIVLALWTGGTFLLDLAWLGNRYTPSRAFFSVASPAFALATAFDNFYPGNWDRFGFSLLLTHLSAWIFLIAASRGLARHWMTDADESSTLGLWERWDTWSRPKPPQDPTRREPILESNPIGWFQNRNRRDRAWRLVLVLSLLTGLVVISLADPAAPGSFNQPVLQIGGSLTALTLLVIMASTASRFFAEARRAGTMELLLTTPLEQRDMLAGLRRPCRRRLGYSVALVAIWKAFPLILMSLSAQTGPKIGFGGTQMYDYRTYLAITSVTDVLAFALSLYALSWVGIWLGLSSRKPAQAATRTFVYVVIIPAFALTLFQVVLIWSAGAWYFVVMFVLNAIKDIGFASWAQRHLQQDWRAVVTRAASTESSRSGWRAWLSRWKSTTAS